LEAKEVIFYAMFKMGRVCPDAIFDQLRPDAKKDGDYWIITVAHHHNIQGKPAKEHIFRYRIKEDKDDAEFSCGPTVSS
jgi:hypothetical protein